jgi:SAM-dependent methyltransferase
MLRKHAGPHSKLLDVGCGYSRFYSLIHSYGCKYTGVDSNSATVEHNRMLGRTAMLPEELVDLDEQFDIVLFSHVIEHLDYASLVCFFNQYLGKLRSDGIVIILTPLYHRGFYDDFDHVKPYNPAALRQLLCGSTKQLQSFKIGGTYTEVGLWLKRDPLWHSHSHSRWNHLAEVPFALLSIISGGCIGKLTGYGMVLQKATA